jgi:ABC-type sugar transport system ATPase subunit
MLLNLINGKVIRKNGALAFSSKVMEFFLPANLGKIAWLNKMTCDKDIYLAIKSSDIKPDTGRENNCIHLQGEIITVNPVESGVMILARVGDENISIDADSSIQYCCGQSIQLTFSSQDAFLVRAVPAGNTSSCCAL